MYLDPNKIDSMTESMYDYHGVHDAERIDALIHQLLSWGLREDQVTILVERDIMKKSFREICEEHGFIDIRTVARLYKEAMKSAKQVYDRRKGM